ncbi:MAG: HAMP domain-containing protein [Alphaproteobacteria bacterium]|nr:HAMP domain-containing protein [Alphaproteobacteria bacterium]
MRSLLPRSLAGRLIALLLLALVVSQAVSIVIFLDERRHAVRAAGREAVLVRTAALFRLLQDTPAEIHGRIVETMTTPRLRAWLDDESAVDSERARFRNNRLARRLDELLGGAAEIVLVEASRADDRWFDWDDDDDDDHKWRDDRRSKDGRRWREGRKPLELTISVRPRGGHWLNVETVLPPAAPAWAWPSLVSMAVMALAIAVIVVFVVRRITRPMQRLAEAADGLGRGENLPAVVEDGPLEVGRTTRAFNRMRERLERFVRDRTLMLAAISHDLRTPITSLRLRAELLDDEDARDKFLATLDEMQRMTEAVLAFVREEAAAEDTRRVDLSALVQSLCDDLADMGMDVTGNVTASSSYACRPVSLKRAIRNLIENAVAYGHRARVGLRETPAEFVIVIDDDGPGIADADRERVFGPFVRLEESRSRDTGGIGLGMAIARSIVRSHGGDVTLANRDGGGLRATITLPRDARA